MPPTLLVAVAKGARLKITAQAEASTSYANNAEYASEPETPASNECLELATRLQAILVQNCTNDTQLRGAAMFGQYFVDQLDLALPRIEKVTIESVAQFHDALISSHLTTT